MPSILNGFAKVRPNPRRHRARFFRRVIRESLEQMTTDPIERMGFAPHAGERVRGWHCTILIQFIAAATLVMSIAVAATAVTIGIARAEAVMAVISR
jgi:hypothetical protein